MYGSVKAANLPMSKRIRARLDQHCAAQSKYRNRLMEKKAPTREDFGRAALNISLLLYNADPGSEAADGIRRAIISQLEYVGFDREQAEIRFGKMAARAEADRERWLRKREWNAELREKSSADPV